MADELEIARTRFKHAYDSWQQLLKAAVDDHRFAMGDGNQWPQYLKDKRSQRGQPCFESNQIQTFLNQVINEFRQNMPAIKVDAEGEAAETETADIIEGLTRSVETRSRAYSAYAKAFYDAIAGGIGWVRVEADYCDDDSFDQSLWIKRIKDFSSVFADPNANEADFSDAEYMFVVDNMSRDEFKHNWPGAEASTNDTFDTIAERFPDWCTEDTVQVAEYWFVERKKERKYLFSDKAGNRVALAEDQEPSEDMTPVAGPDGQQVSKMGERRQVKCWYINGAEVLEKYEWKGKWIPLVPFLGNEYIIGGQRYLTGMVRNMRDPQVRVNAMMTAQIEAISLAPKAPFIADVEAIKGLESMWQNANTEPYAVLPFNSQGGTINPPQRANASSDISAISQALMQSENDLKSVTGIFSASLGQGGPESSGKAILARQKEGDTATAGYMLNAAHSISHVGRILVDLFPYYYDTPQVVQIVKPDQQSEAVRINEEFEEKPGKIVHYDITVGKYAVTVSTGPSYSSLREQTFDRMSQIIQAYPQSMQIFGDLFFKTVPLPAGMGNEIADRLHKLLPPQLQEQDQPVPPQAQAQLQQMGQMIDAMTKQLHSQAQEIESKSAELASRERIVALQEQTKLNVAELGASVTAGQALIAAELKQITQHREISSKFLMAAADHEAGQQQPGVGPAQPTQTPQGPA